MRNIMKAVKTIVVMFVVLVYSTTTLASGVYGQQAYAYMKIINEQFPSRRAGTENNVACGNYIRDVLAGFGYKVEEYTYVCEGIEITDYVVIKQGEISDKVLIVGAHYDSVETAGADDNASGVGTVLELAERLQNVQTPYTIKFCFWNYEETGKGAFYGSASYVNTMAERGTLDRVALYINIDSIAAGDTLNVYGGDYDINGNLIRDWGLNDALEIGAELNIGLRLLPEQSVEGKSPTRPGGSDQFFFNESGIPYIYFEAALICSEDGTGGNDLTRFTCHYQTADERLADTGGQVMHTAYDDLTVIESYFPGRALKHCGNVVQIVEQLLIRTGAAEVKEPESSSFEPTTSIMPEPTFTQNTSTAEPLPTEANPAVAQPENTILLYLLLIVAAGSIGGIIVYLVRRR